MLGKIIGIFMLLVSVSYAEPTNCHKFQQQFGIMLQDTAANEFSNNNKDNIAAFAAPYEKDEVNVYLVAVEQEKALLTEVLQSNLPTFAFLNGKNLKFSYHTVQPLPVVVGLEKAWQIAEELLAQAQSAKIINPDALLVVKINYLEPPGLTDYIAYDKQLIVLQNSAKVSLKFTSAGLMVPYLFYEVCAKGQASDMGTLLESNLKLGALDWRACISADNVSSKEQLLSTLRL